MGFGKWVKKHVAKAVNTVTGGNEVANSILGVGLALPTGGASMSVANQANRDVASAEARKEAEAEAAAVEQQRQKDFSANVKKLNKTAEDAARTSASYTDTTSMRGLLGDYGENSSMGAFDVWKRRRRM